MTSSTGTTLWVVECGVCGIQSFGLSYKDAESWKAGIFCYDWTFMRDEGEHVDGIPCWCGQRHHEEALRRTEG